jgi:hypothetical protein
MLMFECKAVSYVLGLIRASFEIGERVSAEVDWFRGSGLVPDLISVLTEHVQT